MSKNALRDDRQNKRMRYGMLGNAIISGEKAPVFIPKKTAIKRAPTGGGAVANAGALFSIGEGAVKLGLSAVFTPRKVIDSAKRGFRKDLARAEHHYKYNSALSPVYEGWVGNEQEREDASHEDLLEGRKDKTYFAPQGHEDQRQLRKKLREEQGVYENKKWTTTPEYEQHRIDRNNRARTDSLKAEVVGIPPVDRMNTQIPLARRQNIKLYPNIEDYDKMKRDANDKLLTKEEMLKIIQEKDQKTIPINGIFRRIKSVQYSEKKYPTKEAATKAVVRQDIAATLRLNQKDRISRREPESRFGLTTRPAPQAIMGDNLLLYNLSKILKPTQGQVIKKPAIGQVIKTEYKQTGTTKSNYYQPENKSLNLSSKRSKLTDGELQEERGILQEKFSRIKSPFGQHKFNQTMDSALIPSIKPAKRTSPAQYVDPLHHSPLERYKSIKHNQMLGSINFAISPFAINKPKSNPASNLPPLERYKSIKNNQVSEGLNFVIKPSGISTPKVSPAINVPNPQNIKTSYKSPSRDIKSEYVHPINYNSPLEGHAQRTYRLHLKGDHEESEHRKRQGWKPQKPLLEDLDYLRTTKKQVSSPMTKNQISNFWGASKIWLNERSMIHPFKDDFSKKSTPAAKKNNLPNFNIGNISMPSVLKPVVKKSAPKKVSPPKVTKRHPYISAADQDRIDAQKAKRYHDEKNKKSKKGGK